MQVTATVGHAERSGDLCKYIEEGKKIIISTVQKFPFILDEIAAEVGKTFAIVIDEAHSSQGGKTSAAMSEALSSQAEDDGDDDTEPDPEDTINDALAKRMKARKMLANASYFAFTATPKSKTLEMFGVPLSPDAEVVPIKTGEQLDLQALHRVRDRLVHRRTAVINHRFNFIMRSGRAFLYPIYKSTFERGDAIRDDTPNMTAAYRDHMIMWAKDIGRSVDHLETRSDIAKDRIGYIGLSTGLAPVFLAIERRLSLGVVYMGGFYLQPSLPEADAVNFAPYVKTPVLMLNGRFDYFFPTASSQEPLFDLFGTPPEHKRRIVFEASQNIPRNEMIKEVVNWMERYWGPPTSRY